MDTTLDQPLQPNPFPTLSAIEMLQTLGASGASGVLNLEPSGLRIYLRQGRIEAVGGTKPLGEVLLRMGVVDGDKLEGFQPRQFYPLGQALVDQGKIEIYDLWFALSEQVREGIGRLLRLPQQSYVFLPRDPLPGPNADISVAEALAEAKG